MAHRKIGFFFSLGILAVGGAAGFYWLREAERPAAYRTVPVERGTLQATISATGTLSAVVTVQVGSQVSGTISQLLVDYNSPVKKDQLIARIDPASFEAKVQQAQADLESSRAAVLNQRAAVLKAEADVATARANVVHQQVAVRDARVKRDARVRLFQEGGVSAEERDTAQATYDSAVAQLEAAQASLRAAEAALSVARAQLTAAEATVQQKQAALAQAQVDLDHTFIRAPVDGTVVARSVDVGQTVAASLQAPTLFLIAQDLTKMQVDTNVDEADVGKVALRQSAAFTVDAFPGERFSGEVVQIRQAAQVVQNVVTYDAVVAVANPDLKLKPGMTANVKILVAQHDQVLLVPNAAFRVRLDGPAPSQRPAQSAARAGASHAPDTSRQRLWVLEGGKPAARHLHRGRLPGGPIPGHGRADPPGAPGRPERGDLRRRPGRGEPGAEAEAGDDGQREDPGGPA